MWFAWQLAIIPSRSGKHKPDWSRRKKGPGYCRRQLFWSFRTQRAIYEVGVQAPDRTRIYAVYYRGSFCGMSTTIYKYMLSDPRIVEEINDIIYRKGSIYIRRGVFTTTNGAMFRLSMKYIKSFFSYAWKSKDRQTGCNRLVKKSKFQISGPPIRRRRSRNEKKSGEESSPAAPENVSDTINNQKQAGETPTTVNTISDKEDRENELESRLEKDKEAEEGGKYSPTKSTDEIEDVKPVPKASVIENKAVESDHEAIVAENDTVRSAVNENEYTTSAPTNPSNYEVYSPEEENAKNERLENSNDKLSVNTPSQPDFSSDESSNSNTEEYDGVKENKSRESGNEETIDNQQAENPVQPGSLDQSEVHSIDFDTKPTPVAFRAASSNPEQFGQLDEKDSNPSRNTF